MIFQNEKQILNIIKYTPPIFTIAIMFIILSILFVENNRTFNYEKNKIESHYEEQNKARIKNRVQSVYNYIQRERKTTEDELKKSLNVALENAHAIMSTIHKNNPSASKIKIKKIIVDALRNIRFNNGRGYFFIYEKTGKNIMLPPVPELEGTDFMQHQDATGTYIIQDMLKLLEKEDKAFYEWHWYKPKDQTKQRRKIGLVKNFKPFDWFIGTGEYIEDFEKNVQEKLLKHIQEIRYGKNGYIFIINYDSIYLSHIRKIFIGQNAVKNNDTKSIKKVISELIKISKEGDGYYTYIQNLKPGVNIPIKKISYVKGLNDWKWMIGTGFYQDDLQQMIELKKIEFDKKFTTYLKNTISTTLILIIILLFASIYFSKKLQQKFEKYKADIRQHLVDNNKQQNIMSQQSKMAAMGEMIGNIAHQWRQPLSTITTTSTGMQLQKEVGLLNDKMLNDGLEGINKSARYLSHTIDDFRNFFKVDKNKEECEIEKILNKAISLVSVQLHNKNIDIIKDIDNITLTTFENELIQVIINILNNARDELVKKGKDVKRLIFISSKKSSKNNIVIDIKDNAGGIPEDILQRVFEPYFTTKHNKQGTGIGLYMSKEIIEKNMNGKIEVNNITYIHESKEYNGASFKIYLPLNENPID